VIDLIACTAVSGEIGNDLLANIESVIAGMRLDPTQINAKIGIITSQAIELTACGVYLKADMLCTW